MEKRGDANFKIASLKDINEFIVLEREFEKSNSSLRKNSGYKPKTNIKHKKYFQSMINKRNAYFYFALFEDKYVGYIFGTINKTHPSGKYGFRVYTKTKEIGYLDSIIVKKRFRNKNISSLMKNSFLDWLKEREISICQLDVAYFNREALMKYKKWGFIEDKVQMYLHVRS